MELIPMSGEHFKWIASSETYKKRNVDAIVIIPTVLIFAFISQFYPLDPPTPQFGDALV